LGVLGKNSLPPIKLQVVYRLVLNFFLKILDLLYENIVGLIKFARMRVGKKRKRENEKRKNQRKKKKRERKEVPKVTICEANS